MGVLEGIRPADPVLARAGGAMRRVRWWPIAACGGWIVQVAVRLVLSSWHAIPVLIPDESGYLLAARLLAGGSSSDLSGRPLYQGGYSLLISPAFWLSSDPATVYRIVGVINALIGASLLIPAHVALRRLGLSRRRAYLVAMATASLPSVTYYGQFAMSDAVLPVAVLTWLLCVHSWIARRRPGWGLAAGLLAAYCSSAHSRGLIIVAVHTGLLVVVLVRRWAPKRDVAMAAGALAAGTAAGWALNAWIRARIYPGGTAPLGSWLTERLSGWDGWGWTLSLATGKIWYLIVSTWGAAGAGLVAAVAVALGAGRAPQERATRAVACVTLAAVTAIAIASSAATPDEGTVANLAYGRYLGCLAPALFVAGVALVMRAPRAQTVKALAATAGLLAACALIVWLHAGDRLARGYFGPFDFPEITVLTWSWTSLKLWWTTLAALLLSAGLAATVGRRIGPILISVAIAANLAAVAVVTHRVIRYWTGRLKVASSLAGARLTPGDTVAVDYDGLPWRIWVSQAFLVRTRLQPIDRFNPATLLRGVTLVVVPWDLHQLPGTSWPAAPPDFVPVTVSWTDTGAWVAWRRI